MGFCGGSEPNPSYKTVCRDASFGDYAEAITIDYDPSVLTFDDLLDAFFRCHDPISAGRSRQYSSILFYHDEAQRAAAEAALSTRPHVSTTLEAAAPFWEAEPYHQKWLLQRKRPLMLALGLTSYDDLLGPAATVLNALAAGKLRYDTALERLEVLVAADELDVDAYDKVKSLIQD